MLRLPRLPLTALLPLLLLLLAGCGDHRRVIVRDASGGGVDSATADGGMDADAGRTDAASDAGMPTDGGGLDPDAACATARVEAEVERLPVDIVWMVDNSVSMEPAIEEVNAGLNDFATLIADSGLDYRVIMLSLRGEGTVMGGDRYAVCIPEPLAGDASCGDGPRFFHVDMDVYSTQPVEQFLGSLAQTAGYSEGEAHGSAPWRDLLRAEATKTLVVVTDDNSRTCDRPVGASCDGSEPPLTETSIEDFPGGGNPFNSRELGPGILTAEYGDLFEGYTFNAVYGWGSESDPEVPCTYPGGGEPPSSGPTYTALVERTGGVRAQICDGSSAWGPFFEDVASAVTRTSRIECNVPLPEPPDGMIFDSSKVNVVVRGESDTTVLGRVPEGESCGDSRGWRYDAPESPTEVILCPAACELAREELGPEGTGLDVQLGCESILI